MTSKAIVEAAQSADAEKFASSGVARLVARGSLRGASEDGRVDGTDAEAGVRGDWTWGEMEAIYRAALSVARGMDFEREALMAKARRLVSGLHSGGWDTVRSETQIVPLIIGENEQALSAAEYLQSQGFAVRAVLPPTVPPGSARLRFSLTSGISDDELLRLENCLNSWRETLPSSAAVAPA